MNRSGGIYGQFGLSYLVNPDLLGSRFCEATKTLSVELIQNFYSVSEGSMLGAPLRRSMGKIATNHVIQIPAEPLKTLTQDKSGAIPRPSKLTLATNFGFNEVLHDSTPQGASEKQ